MKATKKPFEKFLTAFRWGERGKAPSSALPWLGPCYEIRNINRTESTRLSKDTFIANKCSPMPFTVRRLLAPATCSRLSVISNNRLWPNCSGECCKFESEGEQWLLELDDEEEDDEQPMLTDADEQG